MKVISSDKKVNAQSWKYIQIKTKKLLNVLHSRALE
jgi:hypothetical protein